MTRALVTFGVGPARELLNITLPGFQAYAADHGYQLVTCDEIPDDRPASWYKVPALIGALQDHEEALWLDADVLIVDGSSDIAGEAPEGAWQAMVAHHTPDGEVPNHGVWLVRKPMLPVLNQMWAMTQYVTHPWWEQAAGCELLGYNPLVRPVSRVIETVLFERTCWLSTAWNSHRDDEADHPRFWHASVRGDRARLMRERLPIKC